MEGRQRQHAWRLGNGTQKHLEFSGKQHLKHTVANTAIARELAGWCWSLATMTA